MTHVIEFEVWRCPICQLVSFVIDKSWVCPLCKHEESRHSNLALAD